MAPSTISLLSALGILYALGHAAIFCIRLAASCPEGCLRPIVFFAAAFLAVAGPGYSLLRLLRFRGAFRESLLFVLASGIASTGLFLWLMLACGILSQMAIVSWLAFCAVSVCLIAIDAVRRIRAVPYPLRALTRRFAAASPADMLCSAISALLLCAVFESAAGTPFTAWDAAVSWDKWTIDFARRGAIGGYLTGGYPLLLPLVGSIFYRIAGSAAEVLPPEQMLLHGFYVLYPAIMLLSLGVLGRRHGFSGLAAFLFLMASQYVFGDLAIGQADIPLLAFTLAAAALAPRLGTGVGSVAALAVFFFAIVFTKGTGICWAVSVAVYGIFQARRESRATITYGLAAALLLAAPFAVRTVFLAAHPEAVEQSPFLLVMPLKAAHTSIFTPDAAHLRDWLGRLAYDRLLFVNPGLPSAVAAIPAALLLAAALISRRTRALSLFSLATLALWFFFASYDLRNAEIPLCLLAIAAAMLLSAALSAMAGPGCRFKKATASMLVLSWCVLTFPALSGAPLDTVSALAKAPRPPAVWRADSQGRLRFFKPSSDLVNILSASPYGKSAPKVVAGDSLYRLFGERGVYAMQLNGYNGTECGDIFLRCPQWMGKPPAKFRLAASLERTAPYRELWLGCGDGDFRDAEFAIAEERLDVSGAPPCGMLELVFAEPPGEADAVAVSCENVTSEAALFARYVRPVQDGNALRFLYWTGDGSTPRFAYRGPIPLCVRLWTPPAN